MFKYARYMIFVFLFSVISFTAHATLFTLEYSGRLTDRYTPGYDFADYISGTLTFDLSFAADIYPDSEYDSEYRIIPGAADFVTGYVTPNLGINDDSVRVSNGYGEPDNPMPFWDSIDFYDSSILVDGTKDAILIGAEVNHLDWLFDDKIKEFSFTGEQLNDRSTAWISRGHYVIRNGEAYFYPLYEAYYKLDFIALKAVSANVPEAGSLCLLFVAGLALLVRRKGIS